MFSLNVTKSNPIGSATMERRMPDQRRSRNAVWNLLVVKFVHTVVWAFFATSIIAVPVLAWSHHFEWAIILILTIAVEVVVLAANGMRCPLTDLAARYTNDRHANFDIFLTEWLAKHNKTIFGTLYVAAVVLTLCRWLITR